MTAMAPEGSQKANLFGPSRSRLGFPVLVCRTGVCDSGLLAKLRFLQAQDRDPGPRCLKAQEELAQPRPC